MMCDDSLAKRYDALAAQENAQKDAREIIIDEQIRKGGYR